MYSIDKDFVEPYDMLYHYSPSIPYDFPKENLPKEICQKPLLLLYKCYLDYDNANEEVRRGRHCNKFANDFYHCKRRRDMNIFGLIRDWETEKVGEMSDNLKAKYVSGLNEELNELKKEFEKVPATEENSAKRWRLNADILQTEWRVNYTSSLLKDNKIT
jgi:hypothetical protein